MTDSADANSKDAGFAAACTLAGTLGVSDKEPVREERGPKKPKGKVGTLVN